MSKYELTLCHKTERSGFGVDSYDRIIADDLVSLLSQLIIIIATLHRQELEESSVRRNDDDIPF